jgi:hypothetical protein
MSIQQTLLGYRLSCALVLALLLALCQPLHALDGRYDWAQARDLVPGITYAEQTITITNSQGLTCPYYTLFSPDNPRNVRLHVVRVDSRHPSLSVTTTGRAAGWGEPMPAFRGESLEPYLIRTQRQTTVEFLTQARARGETVVLAINAAPWSPYKPGVEYPFADRLGLTIAQGQLVCPNTGGPSLLVYADGRLDMMAVAATTDLATVRVAVSGFSFCLVDGVPTPPDTELHPRTGYGLSADKRYLYLMVIDGRQAASQGATVREVGEWLRYYGAHTGINMDGGGSSTLAWWDASTQAVQLVNRPAQGQRKNGNHLGIVLRQETQAH